MATPDSPEAAEAVQSQDDSRAAVEAAFDLHEKTPTDAPVTAAPDAPAPDAPAPDAGTSGRDALGRFAPKKTDDTPAQPVAEAAPATQRAPDAAAVASAAAEAARHAKAPASWKPEESAHWDKTPAEVRDAVMRREIEMNRALQESSDARRGLSTLQQAIAPYITNIQAANGGDVVGSIKTFFDYDNRLRHGTQIEKAKAVTALIKGYGIDIATLDNELAGAPHDPQQMNQSAMQAAIAAQLAPVREYMARQNQTEAQQRQAMAQQVDAGITAFARDPAHKHYEAVREDMADALELASTRGRTMTLKQAYETACWQNPQIRSILLSEQSVAGAQAGAGAAQRARAAAVSVRPSAPAGSPASQGREATRSRMDDISAAVDALSGATE